MTRKRQKLTPEEREARKHANSARRKNARLQAETPLFAAQAVADFGTTAATEAERWRRNKIGCLVHQEENHSRHREALDWLRERQQQELARGLLPPDVFAACLAKRSWLRRYGAAYCLDLWYQALKDVIPGLQEQGIRAIQFPDRPVQPDDGGLWDRVQAALTKMEQHRV